MSFVLEVGALYAEMEASVLADEFAAVYVLRTSSFCAKSIETRTSWYCRAMSGSAAPALPFEKKKLSGMYSLRLPENSVGSCPPAPPLPVIRS
eukprot:6178876-Pleurochrysis_carterae.AAC.1